MQDRERTRRPPPGPVSRLRGAPASPRSAPIGGKLTLADAAPRDYTEAFEERLRVTANGVDFCVYTSLRGRPADEPVALLLHGAGCSALSFGALAERLRGTIGLLAIDQRAHGATRCAADVEYDVDVETLVADAAACTRATFARLGRGVPALVAVGHSAGGSLAGRLAARGELPICATVLIDVTEGTALQALPYMGSWVATRPKSFASVEAAILYVMAKGHVRNLQSARLSVPAQLREGDGRWHWRTQLARTERHWRGWFEGLSAIFLAPKCPKLLILAGVDRLDKTLTIAQMQGKFQNILLPTAGHTIHEDQPDKVAHAIVDFLRRNLLIGDSDAPPSPVFQQRVPL